MEALQAYEDAVRAVEDDETDDRVVACVRKLAEEAGSKRPEVGTVRAITAALHRTTRPQLYTRDRDAWQHFGASERNFRVWKRKLEAISDQLRQVTSVVEQLHNEQLAEDQVQPPEVNTAFAAPLVRNDEDEDDLAPTLYFLSINDPPSSQPCGDDYGDLPDGDNVPFDQHEDDMFGPPDRPGQLDAEETVREGYAVVHAKPRMAGWEDEVERLAREALQWDRGCFQAHGLRAEMLVKRISPNFDGCAAADLTAPTCSIAERLTDSRLRSALREISRGLRLAIRMRPQWASADTLEWGHIYNRPYMRMLHQHALVLAKSGDYRAALEPAMRLLRLNPNDNQGIRGLAARYLILLGEFEKLGAMLAPYVADGEGDCSMLYSNALFSFWGSRNAPTVLSVPSRDAELQRALKCNLWVPKFLLRRFYIPEGFEVPQYVSVSGSEHATYYGYTDGDVWDKVPGALRWLHECELASMPSESQLIKALDQTECLITFRKADGQIREMSATRDMHRVPYAERPGSGPPSANQHLAWMIDPPPATPLAAPQPGEAITVWDTDIRHWRSFKYDTLLAVPFFGIITIGMQLSSSPPPAPTVLTVPSAPPVRRATPSEQATPSEKEIYADALHMLLEKLYGQKPQMELDALRDMSSFAAVCHSWRAEVCTAPLWETAELNEEMGFQDMFRMGGFDYPPIGSDVKWQERHSTSIVKSMSTFSGSTLHTIALEVWLLTDEALLMIANSCHTLARFGLAFGQFPSIKLSAAGVQSFFQQCAPLTHVKLSISEVASEPWPQQLSSTTCSVIGGHFLEGLCLQNFRTLSSQNLRNILSSTVTSDDPRPHICALSLSSCSTGEGGAEWPARGEAPDPFSTITTLLSMTLEHQGAFDNLRVLNLRNIAMQDAHLTRLVPFLNLRVLKLPTHGSYLCDCMADVATSCRQLVVLDIEGQEDIDLHVLLPVLRANASTLKELNVMLTSVTDQDLFTIAQTCPALIILTYGNQSSLLTAINFDPADMPSAEGERHKFTDLLRGHPRLMLVHIMAGLVQYAGDGPSARRVRDAAEAETDRASARMKDESSFCFAMCEWDEPPARPRARASQPLRSAQPSSSSAPQVTEADTRLCSTCERRFPQSGYSGRQWKAGTKRRCLSCQEQYAAR